jgi:hypothetical protein
VNEVHRFARRMREEPDLSRNRHFDELSQPEALRARRLLRRLAGLERELRSGGTVEVRPHGDGGYRVTIDFPSVRARRVTYLTAEEHELLGGEEALRRFFGDGRLQT